MHVEVTLKSGEVKVYPETSHRERFTGGFRVLSDVEHLVYAAHLDDDVKSVTTKR